MKARAFDGTRDRLQTAGPVRLGLLLALLLQVLLSSVAAAQQAPRVPRRHLYGDGPRSSTPEEQGMDSVRLAQAIDYLASQRDRYYIHSMTILRHGSVVADAAFWPYLKHGLHATSSGGKPTVSMLMGIAIDRGYIAGVHERVLDFFPDRVIANRTPWKEAITIEHLLTQTSGLGGLLPYEDENDAMEASEDWLQFCLDLPVTTEPGTVWRYANTNCYLLSAILTQATGMSALEFANRYLMGPLGVTRWIWETSPQGINDGSGGQVLSPQAWARLGQLMLQEGAWRRQQLIPRWWVEVSTSLRVAEVDYCYLWSRYPDLDVYWAGGSQGQRMVVSEANDIVAVFTGGGFHHEDIEQVYKNALRSYIFPAVVSDAALAPNPAGVAQLEEVTQRVASSQREPMPVGALPPMAAQVAGRTYVLDFPPGLFELVLGFPSDKEAVLSVISAPDLIPGAPFQWGAGLDGIERFAPGRFGVAAAGTGQWTGPDTFVMNVDEVGMLGLFRVTLVFRGDDVTFTLEDMYYWRPDPPLVLTGHARP